MPIVRKKKYHQKKQIIHQLYHQNQQLQVQLTQLQAENNLLKNASIERERERETERESKFIYAG